MSKDKKFGMICYFGVKGSTEYRILCRLKSDHCTQLWIKILGALFQLVYRKAHSRLYTLTLICFADSGTICFLLFLGSCSASNHPTCSFKLKVIRLSQMRNY
jgi:hypothetical protein